MIGWGSEPDFISRQVLGLAAVILAQLICGEPMRKNRRKSAGKMRQSITRHGFNFVYAFKKEEILFG